jgi:hypothetical protein
LSFATCVYGFFLFDTVGDEHGWRLALVIAMAMVGWCLLIYLSFDKLWRIALERIFGLVDPVRRLKSDCTDGVALSEVSRMQ